MPLFIIVLLILTSEIAFSAVITVDSTSTIKLLEKNPLGVSINNLTDSSTRAPIANQQNLEQGLVDLGAHWQRFPEGEQADIYLWGGNEQAQTANTPQWAITGLSAWPANDLEFSNSDFTPKNIMSFDDFMSKCLATGGEPIIVVAYDSAYKVLAGSTKKTLAELKTSAVNWVKYANTTRNWNVTYWEIGNETDIVPEAYGGADPGSAQQAADIIAFSTAMKAVDPSIKIGVNTINPNRLTALLNSNGFAAAIDFISIHNYPVYAWDAGYAYYQNNTPDLAEKIQQASNAIQGSTISVLDKERLNIFVTETNIVDWADSWKNINDLGHAIVNFEMLGQLLQKPRVKNIQQWVTRWIHDETASIENIIQNGNFENGNTNWSGQLNSGVAYTGQQSAQVMANAAIWQDITSKIQAGATYSFNGWIKAASTSPWSGMGVSFKKNGVQVGSVAIQCTSTNWKEYTSTITAPASFDYAELWVYAGSTLQCDNLRMVKGTFQQAYGSLSALNVTTPIGKANSLWGKYLVGNLVQSVSDNSNIRVFASSDTKKTTIFLINKGSTAELTQVNITSAGPITSAVLHCLSGTGPEDLNPQIVTSQMTVSNNSLSMSLPAYSVSAVEVFENPLTNFRRINGLNADGSEDTVTGQDGIPHLLKYAFNMLGSTGQVPITTPNSYKTNTANNITSGLPNLGVTNNRLEIFYPKLMNPSSGLTYITEFSTDLTNWSSQGVESRLYADNHIEQVKVTSNISGNSFARVKIVIDSTGQTLQTEPLGITSTSITAGTIGTRGLSFISAGLFEEVTIQGQVRGSITAIGANYLTNSNANWRPSDFSTPHLIRITSGNAKGHTFLISNSSTATTAYLDPEDISKGGPSMRGVVIGDLYEIIPCDTLIGLFGTPGTTGIIGATSPANADQIQIFVSGAWRNYYFNTGLGYWCRVGPNTVSNNLAIRPDSAVIYQRVGPAFQLQLAGWVPRMERRVQIANSGITPLSSFWPIVTTLSATEINMLPNWKTNNLDNVQLFSSAWRSYFFNNTWRRVGPNTQSNTISITPNTGILINRTNNSGFSSLVQPLPY